MKRLIFSILLLFSVLPIFAQKPYTKEGVYFSDNGNVLELAKDSKNVKNANPVISPNKNFICWVRTHINPNKQNESSEIDITEIMMYNLKDKQTSVLFQGCDGEKGGTMVNYANSQEFNFPCVFGIKSLSFSDDSEKLVFVSSAWQVSDAIHSISLQNGEINFIHSGRFLKWLGRGNAEIEVTGTEEKGGRYWQNIEIDESGELVRTTSEKNQ